MNNMSRAVNCSPQTSTPSSVNFHQAIQKANTFIFFVLGILVFPVLTHHKSVNDGGVVFNWSKEYLFLVLLPLFFFWAIQLLFHGYESFRIFLIVKLKKYKWFLIISSIFLILTSMLLKVNVYQARVLLFIFSVLTMFIFLSSLFHIKDLMMTYLCFNIFGCLLFAFEVPQLSELRHNKNLIDWNKSGIFKYLFETEPPFLGLGGR